MIVILALLIALVVVSIVAILIVTIGLLVGTPYDNHRLSELEMKALGEDVILRNTRPPFPILSSVQNELNTMMMLMVEVFDEKEIEFWLAKSTLLGCVRHGQLLPWGDKIEICVHHEDLSKLVSSREKIEESGDFKLANGSHGYFIQKKGRFVPYPFIQINIMKRTEHETSICTPMDELVECSFADSHKRRNEIYLNETLFPLASETMTIGTTTINVKIPRDSERCLTILYGENWKSVYQRNNIHLNNSFTDSFFRIFGR